MSYRPQARTIRNVVEYLESIGLSVYGSAVDLDIWCRDLGCMDYDAEQIIKYRKLLEKNGRPLPPLDKA